MTLCKRITITIAAILVASAIWGQAPKPTPTLSTADKVAIQTFEKAKQDAQKQFNDAQQGELSVLREWESAHPGFLINPKTFVVTAEPAKVEPKKDGK
jgi:hypothetical protein